MKVYNQSLDYMTLAMVASRQGDPKRAAKLFASAIGSPDCVRAVQILENSNKMAYAATQVAAAAAVKAKAKPAVAKAAAKPVAKPAPAVAKAAAKPAPKAPVKAAKEVVAEFDMGDADLDALIGEGDEGEEFETEDFEDDAVDEGDDVDASTVEAAEGEEFEVEEEEEEGDDAQFATVLASMPQIVSRTPKRR